MSKKFQVKAVPGRNNDAGGGAAAEAGPSQPTFTLSAPGEHDEGRNPEEVALTMQSPNAHHEAQQNLFLYDEDMKQMPRVATFLKNLRSYHTTYPTEKEAKEAKKQPKKAKLGTILGVYLPTIQHIFGVLMFVRLAWIVGNAGTLLSFGMVFMCCVTTFVTAISMSAIATNGMVQAGGSYFMISRNLGPECGGAVGICFYLANTFATDLYLLGAIEILLQYMAPGLAYFGDIHHNPFNNYRVYGTAFLILITLVVAVGVKFVQLFAPFSLSCVIISILCVFIGSFQATKDTRDVWICLVGDRLLELPDDLALYNDTTPWCSADITGAVWDRYCNGTSISSCDQYFQDNNVRYIPGIPGIASGVIQDNLFSSYLAEGEVTPGVKGDTGQFKEVTSDLTTSFVMLCAIYFPSVTGIMTGSNMSGDLKDPQKSIPVGTILANITCSFVYLSFVLLFGSTSEGALLRDKYGKSLGGSLLAARLCWPHEWVVLVGGFCSTLGAALQCLTSAPRLLQAIARDNIIPFLDVFKVTTKSGEPIRALLLTALIAEAGILIASLDYVAHVIDVFFLMCYAMVNLTCALLTLMHTAHWRPRFKYYHWSLSVLGVVLNLALSIIAGWYYALAAFAIAAFIYKYVEYKGGEKEWGDGITGLTMSTAQKALLQLDEGDPHTKNWRPQLLVLCKITSTLQPKYRRIFSFASQLKAGKGLTVLAGVLEGNYLERTTEAQDVKQVLKTVMKEEKVKGFAKVMVAKDQTEGLNIFVQTAGLGGMRHNAVMVGWPYGWRHSTEERSWKVFMDTIRVVTVRELALLVPRNIEKFPDNKERLTGTIDVWWIVHDGGMLILLSFLLQQHKVWRQCKLRIFTVAQMSDNSIQLKKDLKSFLYQLRINAEVHVEEMYDSDISAYTVERTLDAEKRARMLKELKLGRRGTIQEIVDASHLPRNSSSGQFSGVNSTPPPRPKSETNGKGGATSDGAASASASAASADKLPEKKEPELKSASETDVKVEEKEDTNHKPEASASVNFLDPNAHRDPEVHFTFSASDQRTKELSAAGKKMSTTDEAELAKMTEDDWLPQLAEGKLMRMHTAVRLNQSIKSRSQEAELVIINFPAPPAKLSAEENYMEYLEALTEGLERVLMVRGTGQEVVTIYS